MYANDGIIRNFKDQDYDELKSEYDSDNLFEDPLFPADDSSLYTKNVPPREIRWMRPREAMENADFVVDGFGRCDMDQGYIGNCWFIAGVVGIMQNDLLFSKVVPENQSFDDEYSGIFHFRFWLYGEWVDVVVDDRLPFWPDGSLVFCSNKEEPNEFWSPLLEKAYAKLYGNYENLEAGQTYDALIDMSGGIQESFDLTAFSYTERKNFWDILMMSYERDSILGCSINPDPYVLEARLSNGLVKGHAFTITNLTICETSYDAVKLIRIRNPWGNDVEWNGRWSDNSFEWKYLSGEEKERLDHMKEHDGEFWMSFDDFMKNFDVVQICHLTASSFSSELTENKLVSDHDWKCTIHHSEWISGSTSGGCGQYNQAKYWTNPQFLIKLVDYEHYEEDNICSVLISLTQKDTRLKRMYNHTDSAEEFIQFRLFKIHDDVEVDENEMTGLRIYGSQLDRMGGSGSYINSREVTQRFKVEAGNYLVIPSTYDEDVDCEFMLRIFTELPVGTNMKPLEDFKEELEEEDISQAPEETDKQKRKYRSYLNPKLYKRKLSEWAKSSRFNVDYDNEVIRFGNDRREISFSTDNDTKSINARIGRHNFGIDYNKGFKFRHNKESKEDDE